MRVCSHTVLAAFLYLHLQAPKAAAPATNGSGPSVAASDVTGSHHALLLAMVADELGCKPTDIGAFVFTTSY